jgi:hypothetical protein
MPGTHPDVPAPPPGPGVQPPFPAPPTDRDNRSLWIGLGVGGALLVLCCVGGILGFGVLVAGGNRIVQAEAKSVVQTYLQAQRDQDYPTAYKQLCQDTTRQISLEEFETRVSQLRLVEFTVGDVVITNEEILVDATTQREGETSRSEQYPVVQEAGVLKVCGHI